MKVGFPNLINQTITMYTNQFTNYALASPQNTQYIYLLKQPKLIANNITYFDQMAPLLALEHPHTIYPMVYYHLRYQLVNKKQSFINIVEATPVGRVGEEWESQEFVRHMLKHQGDLKKPEKNNPFMEEVLEHGELRVNDQGWIFVKSFSSGFRRKFKMVNSPFAIPLLKGCKVDFFQRKYAQNQNPRVKIATFHFPSIRLAGILKLINGRVFFEPRHTDYQRMTPISLPEIIMNTIYEYLTNYKGSLPYTIFKRYDGDTSQLNKKLATLVVQGKFVDWPIKFSHPVIKLQAIEPMNCSNLKTATLYQLGIPMLEYDNQENKLSDEVVYNFNPEIIQGRWKVPDRCYSFDCEGGSCFDDAFSFRKIQNGFMVGIHISDVDEVIKDKPHLLRRAFERDQTIYIKNYYRSMFPEHLRNIMSLQADKLRLAFSLVFQVSEQGKIDYQSIQLRQSIVKVVQNITHGSTIMKKADSELVSELREALKHCPQVQNLLLFNEIETATLTSQLLYLSSYLPIAVYQKNIQFIPKVIKTTEHYINQICQEVDNLINEVKIKNEVQKSATSDKVLSTGEQKVNLQQSATNTNDTSSPPTTQKVIQSIKMTKTVEGSPQYRTRHNCNQLLEESVSLENSQEGIPQNINYKSPYVQKNQFFKKVSSKQGSAAECFRFLDKIFRAADMKIDFSHIKNIQNAFKLAEKKFKDPTVQLYFRTKLIMSKQHFEDIAKLKREEKLKNFEQGNSAFQYPPSPEKKYSIDETYSNQEDIPKIQLKKQEQSQKIPEKLSDSPTKEEVKVIQESKGIIQPKVEEKKVMIQKQGDLSIMYNILSGLLEMDFGDYPPFERQDIQKRVNKIKSISQEKDTKIIDKSFEQRRQYVDKSVLSLLKQSNPPNINTIKTLKWNTPIRSGASLQALILLKHNSWIFQGCLFPSTTFAKQKQLPHIKQKFYKLLSNKGRQQPLQLTGRMKEACRQLAKIDFLFELRKQPDRLWDFVTITSPSLRVQFVYHEFIEEVQVDNPQKDVIYYSKVKGKFKGIFEFPVKLKVVLEEK